MMCQNGTCDIGNGCFRSKFCFDYFCYDEDFYSLLDKVIYGLMYSRLFFQETLDQLKDLLHLISAHSHLFSSDGSSVIDLTQLALIQPTSDIVFDLALKNSTSKDNCGTLYYKWL